MPWLRVLILFLALALLIFFVQLHIITVAFEKLGLSPGSAYLLLITTLIGSSINLPLFKLKVDIIERDAPLPNIADIFLRRPLPFRGYTVIAINLGGGLIPIVFSIFLLSHYALDFQQVMMCIALVTAVAYVFSQTLSGVGVIMPIFLAPLTAALLATWINPELRAPLAYISGTIGVLLGADIFRLKDIRKLGVPIASIGGAGSFDGIFLTGIIAVLLA